MTRFHPAVCLLPLLTMLVGCDRTNEFVPPPPPTVTVATPVVRDVAEQRFTGRTEAYDRVEIRPGYPASCSRSSSTRAGPPRKAICSTSSSRPRSSQPRGGRSQPAGSEADRDLKGAVLQRIEARSKGAAPVELLEGEANTTPRRPRWIWPPPTCCRPNSISNTPPCMPRCRADCREIVSEGNLVWQGHYPDLINKVDPIKVFFEGNERDLIRFIKKQPEMGRTRPDVARTAILDDRRRSIRNPGVVDFSDNTVDKETGTILIQGVFDNPDKLLVPGLFVQVLIPRPTKPCSCRRLPCSGMWVRTCSRSTARASSSDTTSNSA